MISLTNDTEKNFKTKSYVLCFMYSAMRFQRTRTILEEEEEEDEEEEEEELEMLHLNIQTIA